MVVIPQKTVDAIYDFHHDSQDGNRPHLGCSVIGAECERYLWLTFRHALWADHPGRIVRLFKRGKLEEAIFETELKKIGCKVIMGDDVGNQFRVSWHGGHFAGTIDGVISGLVEAPRAQHILEIKTINDKGYKQLERKGLENARINYFAQCQLYMKGQNLKHCLFLATNKNTDEIYMERVKYNSKVAKYYLQRAKNIIEMTRPPERRPDDQTCKWCEYKQLCHGKQMPQSVCRTCVHSTPMMDGNCRWVCERFDCNIDLDIQAAGNCPKHLYIPDLINCYDMVDSGNDWVKYRNPINNYKFKNGDRKTLDEKDAFTSDELSIINPDIQGHAALNMVREVLNGKITDCRPETNNGDGVPF